ncbi:agip104 [Agrotis ipsilon multiple nucleopolyhedrovirus]|uniref:Late expression factor-3 n=1 Tax=Agrotis ipsilon multiple nucleopolyhedrovirus TaxID=208013 RepID=B6D618_9ABAC|nr:agip104 [Agrotis ipsilon multiple nucleopolyhedrovirus]ACI28805.1 late expression factor-3 [Agrotis ipsilon multiple nucleopolyhedrovirus]
MSSVEESMEQLMNGGGAIKRPLSTDEINESGGDDADVSVKKRSRTERSSPQKRLSNVSTTSSDSTIKKIGKTVTGQLVTKNMYCVNNEAFYLFKFLIENVSKNYYGNAGHYQTLRIDATYEIELVYENKRLGIGKATECKDSEKIVVVKRFVEQSDFDSEDTVSVAVKFKYGFKVLDSDLYKVVFVVNYGDNYENCQHVQIECMANLKRWTACIKDETIFNEHNLLEYFYNAQNQMFNLCRVKCQQSNGNYKNFSIQNITHLSLAAVKPACLINEDPEKISSISRSNKRVVHGLVNKIKVEHQTPERYSIAYTLKNESEEWVRGSFYVRQQQQQNDKKSDKLEKLVKLETDLNQLNDLIENDIVMVHIYVAADLSSKNYNVLGLTKIELDTDIFEGI